ncbi:MAG TPA: Crp/Fnr family transcriptional regulator [Puia sp.]|jgi:CRP-like cAMP-binding protein|nr:Crp/Fnr family transcriptional regulator [Puia sp.]
MESFFKAVAAFMQLSEESKLALSSILKPLEFPKGHVLVRQDSVCQYVYFIEKGLTRTFYYKDGKDVTDWLSAENMFACSIISFLTRQPDRRGIELLEDSCLWGLHYEDLERLYRQYHDVERLGRLLVSSGLIQLQQRFDDLHFATAAQRYQTLMETNATFIQRAPLGIIASYLGITQETLSRIRSQH